MDLPTTSFTTAIRRVVEREGRDYVYESPAGSCQYVHNDEPGCLIGAALYEMGIPLNVLREFEGKNAEALLVALMARRHIVVSEVEIAAANAAQQMQDDHQTWGAALDVYEASLEAAARHE